MKTDKETKEKEKKDKFFPNATSIKERWNDEGGTMLHSLSFVPEDSEEYKLYYDDK